MDFIIYIYFAFVHDGCLWKRWGSAYLWAGTHVCVPQIEVNTNMYWYTEYWRADLGSSHWGNQRYLWPGGEANTENGLGNPELPPDLLHCQHSTKNILPKGRHTSLDLAYDGEIWTLITLIPLEQSMDKLRQYIFTQNQREFIPKGLRIPDPCLNGLRYVTPIGLLYLFWTYLCYVTRCMDMDYGQGVALDIS